VHSYDVFRHYERQHWQLGDLDLDAVDPALVRLEYALSTQNGVHP
jgi:hypothetical protein